MIQVAHRDYYTCQVNSGHNQDGNLEEDCLHCCPHLDHQDHHCYLLDPHDSKVSRSYLHNYSYIDHCCCSVDR